mgnify:FL=1
MAFDAEKFRSAFNGTKKQDFVFASGAYFEVQFHSLPAIFKQSEIKDPIKWKLTNEAFNNMRFRCFSTDLPSRQVVGLSRQLAGPQRIIPYAANYTTTMLDFIETPRFNIRTFFDTWIDIIEGKNYFYETAYYDDLIIDEVTIFAYNKSGEKVAKWVLKNVIPMSLNNSMLNWESQNQHITIPVEIGYSTWDFYPLNPQ